MLMIITVFLPILAGILPSKRPVGKFQVSHRLVMGITLLTSVLVWVILLQGRGQSFELFPLYNGLSVFFSLDYTGMIFAGLVSFLWPLATLYAFEYMENDERERGFFSFYAITYGVTLGIAYSGNFLTMYFFYEMLTLATFPLVLHYRDKASRSAARIYLYYSIGGAAFAFVGLVFIIIFGTTTNFVLGGVLNPVMIEGNENLILGMFLLGFFGFGVKAAVFPLQKWLPTASVAPTPVTALLHAVAVVKSGAFAIIRLIYFSYGADFIRGTWAQYVAFAFVAFTVAYGSTMAVKEIHFKKRLAYSTIANLSYILLGAVMMTTAGLQAALTHLVVHAVMKICAFFCAGAVMHRAEKNYVYELDGLAKKMPITFACFTVSGLSLMGVPMLGGFISKWAIAESAVKDGSVLGVIAVSVLLYSALMTGIYMMTVVVRAYFPKEGFDYSSLDGISDPTWKMLFPITLFAVLLVVLGVAPKPLLSFIALAAGGEM